MIRSQTPQIATFECIKINWDTKSPSLVSLTTSEKGENFTANTWPEPKEMNHMATQKQITNAGQNILKHQLPSTWKMESESGFKTRQLESDHTLAQNE